MIFSLKSDEFYKFPSNFVSDQFVEYIDEDEIITLTKCQGSLELMVRLKLAPLFNLSK